MMPAMMQLAAPMAFNGMPWLTGTTGSPNVSTDSDFSSGTATSGWNFNSDGTLDRYQSGSPVQWDTDPEQWIQNNLDPARDLWIRFTTNAGDLPTTSTGTLGVTWNPVSSLAQILWVQSGVGDSGGSCKVEIATDSGGANIIMTGYYGGNSHVESGA